MTACEQNPVIVTENGNLRFMKTMKPNDNEILCALVRQVQKAANGRSEAEVVTLISRKMWRAFLRATGSLLNSKPSEWMGIGKTCRVFGSQTIVTKDRGMVSMSFRADVLPKKIKLK